MRGTVAEVIAASGLSTIVVSGKGVARIAEAVRGRPGVEQVAPFGNDLHVVGVDADTLHAAVQAAIAETGAEAVATPGETGLEDVFIRLMSKASVADQDGSGR